MKLTELQMADFSNVYEYLRFTTKLPEQADAIVVGGSGTRTDMSERAAELYHQGIAPTVVFSGFAHPNYGATTEADLLADKAIELGVSENAIIRERHATNTGLNVQLSARALAAAGIRPQKVVLVHKPYATRRFMATAEAQWPVPQPEFYTASVNDTLEQYLERCPDIAISRTLAGILKDYRVTRESPALGFQSEQPFDELADEAYRRLIEQGFIGHELDHTLATDRFEALADAW